MRLEISVDDALLEDAKKIIGLSDASAVISVALKAVVAREAAKRLAALGGTEPGMKSIPRRRSTTEAT